MSPTITAPPKIDRLRDGERRVVIRHVDWETYDRLCDCTDGQTVHMTYDRGDLGIHEPIFTA